MEKGEFNAEALGTAALGQALGTTALITAVQRFLEVKPLGVFDYRHPSFAKSLREC